MAPKPRIIIEALLTTGMTQTETAKTFGVSDRWVRTLVRRYRQGGYETLEPRSRRPHNNPHTTPETTITRIIELRTQLTEKDLDNDANTIAFHLHQEGITPPSKTTIHKILHNHNLVTPQPKKRPRNPYIQFQSDTPNETWQLDYSEWKLATGKTTHILTILDDHSRYIITCKAFTNPSGTNLLNTFITAGNEHRFPQSTLTDNAGVFTTRLVFNSRGPNSFEQLLDKLGIQQKNGAPYHPQTQGKVERYHRTMKKYLATLTPADHISTLNTQLTEWITYYNHHRPHHALGKNTPHTAYTARPKATPTTTIRLRKDRVDNSGKITLRWRNKLRRLYIGTTYARTDIVSICQDNNITTYIPNTGETIAKHTLQENRSYHPNLLNKPGNQ